MQVYGCTHPNFGLTFFFHNMKEKEETLERKQGLYFVLA